MTEGSLRTVVLAFHGIGEPHPWCPADERPYWCTRERFVAVLDTVLNECTKARVAPVFTFDDGNRSDLEVATPELARRGVRGEFFVCTGRIGGNGYLDLDALREMRAAGMLVGSHGRDHVDWRRCDDATLGDEVCTALADLGARLGEPVDRIAIPFGSYDRRVLRVIARSGAQVVYSTDEDLPRSRDVLTPRFTVTANWSVADVQRMLARTPGSISTLKRRAIQFLKRTLPR